MHHQQSFTSASSAFAFPPETVVQAPVVINSDSTFTSSAMSSATPALLTHSATPTFQQIPCTISQQNDTLLMCQRISDSIKEFKKNAKKQLEQADDLKGQLKQLKQILIQQQQTSPMPRRINRTRVHRSHPYLYNEQVPPYTSNSAAPTDYHSLFSNDSHPQQGEQAGVTAAPAGFLNNNEFFSS